MAKTVKQLEAEYADITEKNRKAYDEFKGTGTGIYKWQIKYRNLIGKANPTAAEKAYIEQYKPVFEAAQAEYKRTQDAKNALKKELDAARKAETAAKEGDVSKKSAQSNYDKAISALNIAKAQLGGYKGEQGYIDAYKVASAAADALKKAGGTPTLPAPAIEIPAGKTDTGTGKDGTQADDMSLSDRLNFLTDPKNKDILITYQKALAKNFGYKGNTLGNPDKDFAAKLAEAYATRNSLPEAWRGTSVQDFIFKPTVSLSSSGTATTGPDKTTIRSYTVQFDKTQAESAINKMFQSELGRDMTDAEFSAIWAKLDAAQKNNPTKYKVVTDSSGYITKDSKQTGGLDVDQYIKDLFKSGADGKLPGLKDEYATVKMQSPDLTKLGANKKIYDAAIAAAGKDIGKIQKIKESTAYGRGLKELQTQINDYIVNQGGTNSPEEVANFAQGLYDRGYDLSSEVGLSELQNFIKYGAGEGGAFTGKAGTIVSDLAATAMANGLDLQKTFGTKLQGWLTDINKGEPIDNIKRQIREVAKIGMPDNVKKLLDNGMDLDAIYSPYKSTMASVLELSPESIQLSDPTLRAAITGQGEVPLYDFERALRKDNRWQYTNQARGEVANATQRILQDFGFMG